MNKVIAYGEILFRITPDPKAFAAEFSLGGAELNVATALAAWGTDICYVSRLPENVLSKNIQSLLQGLKIDTSRMLWGGERIGIYYMAPGGDMQSHSVVYDRKYSSFSELQPGTVDWDSMLEGASWLHWTAITPAINENAATLVLEMLQAAVKKNIIISTDLNYRRLLWKYGKLPHEVMPALAEYCDVIMGNIWSAKDMLGIHWDEKELIRGDQKRCGSMATEVAEKMVQRFPKCKKAAFTFRFNQPDGSLDYFATLYNRKELYNSSCFHRQVIIDSVGSGDSFMAGLIYGMMQEMPDQGLINFATASAVSKLGIKGDANTTPVEQIKQLVK